MATTEKPSREQLIFRCAGPHCGILKGHTDRWWLMWPSKEDGRTVLSLCEWDAAVVRREGALSVCGEECAQKLQSMFMANILEHHIRSTRAAAAAANQT